MSVPETSLAESLRNDIRNGTRNKANIALDAINEVERLRAQLDAAHDALQQALVYIEADETAHGRNFGTGNAVRAALALVGERQP